MTRRAVLATLLLTFLAGTAGASEDPETLEAQVRAVEEAFARTMADRDHAAFTSFLADEAVFVGSTVLRGRDAVAEGWKRFFATPDAPFSWSPERVAVVTSGTLALTSGPVVAPDGRRVGTFNSTWRREAGGVWKIVLDNGCPRCDCGEARTGQ